MTIIEMTYMAGFVFGTISGLGMAIHHIKVVNAINKKLDKIIEEGKKC